ncbi:phage tail protein [Achromobacter anxifer]|uniref:Phage tail protein n=1 Tax=Achromobacter anxifer TaxID=1287737 RepID=A0A6S7CJH5_9BURK|nr:MULTISPECIES: phage tail protein [Achromobacter]CAB3834385.1 hypothetical protein LMG26858_00860 [Achromobacter anxifer]
MALEEFAGAMVLEVDGKEIEVVSVDPTTNTGVKPVKTMNRDRRVKGYALGIVTYALRVTVVIPLSGDMSWDEILGAKLTIFPASEGGKRVSYLDCCTEEVGESYNVDNEARRDITMFATRKVEE